MATALQIETPQEYLDTSSTMRIRFVILITLLFLRAATLPAAGNPAFAPDAPPVTARITMSAPDAQNEVTIAGAAGAVLARSYVYGINVLTGHYAVVQADAGGAFSMKLVAPRGSSIQLKADPNGRVLPALGATSDTRRLGALPSTMLRVPEGSTAPPPAAAFAGVSTASGVAGAYYAIEGTVNKLTFAPGDELVLDMRIALHSPNLDPSMRIGTGIGLAFARVTLADGRHVAQRNVFGSTFVTPTGLPVERHGLCGQTVFLNDRIDFPPPAGGRTEVAKRISFRIPAGFGPGYYQPHISFFSQLSIPPVTSGVRPGGGTHNFWQSVDAPLIRIGEPAAPRLTALLFADEWSNGTRGVRAAEDRGSYGFAAQVSTQSDALVLPKGRHRLEPHVPAIATSDRGSSLPQPRIPFRLPSGSLTVRLTRPDGTSTTIGPAPFAQSRSIAPAKEDGESFDLGSHHPADIYQLSTMDPRFEVDFDRYGTYTIAIEGSVDDLWGTAWRIRGTYEVTIAEPLVLDTGVLPGTPFEVGDRFSVAVTTIPPVPAEVSVRLRIAPDSDAERMQAVESRGRANRFGFYQPYADAIPLLYQGEYRADLFASYTDARGVLWAGSRTWGGVIAPRETTLLAHGRRGIFFQELPRQAWFRQSQVGTLRFDSHPTFPFHSGDIIWARNNSAMLVGVNQRDTTGEIDTLIRSRCQPPEALEGETPLVSSRPDGFDLHLDPGRVDIWSYAYASVQRPLVRVRELIGDGVEGHQFGYWQFGEQYGAQKGVPFGDRPNDIKFLFGGAVTRGTAVKGPRYGIYGALFVLLPYDDSNGEVRVMPPFRGNGGGPDGGPIMMLRGKPVDLFFHPTAVRPGTILERGATASFAGYVGPPLPAKIEIALTSPGGRRRTINGQANRVGWFSVESGRFDADESGVWRARIKVTFDGRTSAGQVEQPYPAGDVLGSREGEFNFYVVDAGSQPVSFNASLSSPINPFTVVVPPAGLTNAELHSTTMIPGLIVDERSSPSLQYEYRARELAREFPNIDFTPGGSYFDTVTISLLVSGIDAGGVRRHLARQIVLQEEQLLAPDQTPVTPPPRRRIAR